MKQNRIKYSILIVIILSMVFVSALYVTDRDYAQTNKRIAVVYPKNCQTMIQEVQEGIQDYAYDSQIKLDVWYKEKLSSDDLNSLVKTEFKNKVSGILLVYPEKYMKKEKYDYGNVLVLTDTMQKSFTYSASFRQISHETVKLPINYELLKDIKEGRRDSIYFENTYKLGYKSMQMISRLNNKEDLSNIRLNPEKVDRTVLEKDNKASLFAN